MFNLMIIPIILVNGTWEFFPDPILSTSKKQVRNALKRIKLTKIKEDDYEFHLQLREETISDLQVSPNLWRRIESFSDWKPAKTLHFNAGLSKFTSDGFNYEAYIEEINYLQFKLWISLNESWNVSAEQIGLNFFDISTPETWSNSKN